MAAEKSGSLFQAIFDSPFLEDDVGTVCPLIRFCQPVSLPSLLLCDVGCPLREPFLQFIHFSS
jgi:hypothetical protein